MASVSVRKVVKRFDKNEILHGIDLDIHDHEFLVLVGPSGCGKSTLLRMVAGLEEITSGEIYIADTLVNPLPPKEREIAMVFQDYALYPHMSVRENMSFGLRIRKTAKAEIEKRVSDAAGILQIENLLERTPKQLSGGQRQRVAIGRAIVRKPKVFLFDEPLSNLDAKLRGDMRIELARLHQRLNNTIIYVTHDQVEAMTLGTRIVVMNGGYIQQIGTPQEVYRRPANVFVAGFIGSPTMNFVNGMLKKEANKVLFVNEAMKIDVSKYCQTIISSEMEVILGIRPEDITLTKEPGKTVSEVIDSKLDVTELLGHRMNIYINVGESRMLATVDADFSRKTGETVPIYFNLDNIHLFDAKTSVRMK